MIAPINPAPDEPQRNEGVSSGGGGDKPSSGEGVLCDPAHVRGDAALAAKALKRWNIGRHKRRRIVQKLAEWVESDDAKSSIAAAKALIAADSINVRLASAISGTGTTVNVAVGVNVQNTVEGLLNDPNYAAFVESRSSGDSGTVCGNGHAGKVQAPGPHSGNLHGHN